MFIKLVIFLSVSTIVFGQKQIGDPCNVTNIQGICKLFSDCPAVGENLHKYGIGPTICGFQGPQPVVCCQRVPGELSLQKCQEYYDYVYIKVKSPVALIDAPVTKKYHCGYRIVPLVVGGQRTGRREFPHMAVIGTTVSNDTEWYCGGTIISDRYILTAAHCLSNYAYGNSTLVKVGVINLNDTEKHAQVIEIKELIPHPNYSYPSYYHDIALVKLKKSIKLNSYARPACLFTKPEISTRKVIATGWGETEHMTGSEHLRKVILELVGNEDCDNQYVRSRSAKKLPSGILKESQICAGSDTTEIKDTCTGDSGGPLQIYHTGDNLQCMYDIVGITSFGKPCGVVAGTAVYTKVSNYIEWIEKQVWL